MFQYNRGVLTMTPAQRACFLLRGVFAPAIVMLIATAPALAATAERSLTFEDRVRAQETIERVYYSHQIGAVKPFEDAMPREEIENKVRAYLRKSALLERELHAPL